MRDRRISPHGENKGTFSPKEIVNGGIKMIKDWGRAYIYVYDKHGVYFRIKEEHVYEILKNFKGTYNYTISDDGRFQHVYAKPEPSKK